MIINGTAAPDVGSGASLNSCLDGRPFGEDLDTPPVEPCPPFVTVGEAAEWRVGRLMRRFRLLRPVARVVSVEHGAGG